MPTRAPAGCVKYGYPQSWNWATGMRTLAAHGGGGGGGGLTGLVLYNRWLTRCVSFPISWHVLQGLISISVFYTKMVIRVFNAAK